MIKVPVSWATQSLPSDWPLDTIPTWQSFGVHRTSSGWHRLCFLPDRFFLCKFLDCSLDHHCRAIHALELGISRYWQSHLGCYTLDSSHQAYPSKCRSRSLTSSSFRKFPEWFCPDWASCFLQWRIHAIIFRCRVHKCSTENRLWWTFPS